MQCDICGKEAQLFKAKVEGTVLNACQSCASFGEIIGKIAEHVPTQQSKPVVKTPSREEPLQQVVPWFASIIKNKREQLGLKQIDFAKKINEKESLVHKIETGTITPSIELAHKLEHFLGVKLVEVAAEDKAAAASAKSGKPDELTLGDAIKLKK